MTSPAHLSDYAIYVINGLSNMFEQPMSILDVGCGSGMQMSRIKEYVGTDKFGQCVGIDWSLRAVDLLRDKNIYNRVEHAQSSTLPFQDQEFDIAISIENLEHLYQDQIIPAIKELQRVAKCVILITPLPQDCINQQWLDMEIPLAEQDTDPIDYTEWLVLEGTVHKSTVYPQSMEDAGFYIKGIEQGHGNYFAMSNNINTDLIKFSAIKEVPVPNTDDYRQHYVELLYKSKNLPI